MELALTPDTKRMLEGCYVVNNEAELFDTLLKLQAGEDPLAEKRQQIALELFGDLRRSPSRDIVEAIYADFGR